MMIIARYLFLKKICEYLNVDFDDYEFNIMNLMMMIMVIIIIIVFMIILILIIMIIMMIIYIIKRLLINLDVYYLLKIVLEI